MRKKYILFNSIVTLIALVLMFCLGVTVTKNNNISKAEEDIVKITNIYISNYNEDFDYNQSIDEDIRVTIIDSTGKVLADSSQDVSQMSNHINREEIINALNDTPKTCIRRSELTNVDMIYYAKKVNVENDYIFLRVSIPISNVNIYVLKTIFPMLIILTSSLMVSLVISYFFAVSMLNPLNKIKENLTSIIRGYGNKNLPTTSDEDINKILIEINEIEDKIDHNLNELKQSELKLDYILNNISSAIVTFDNKENIDLMNSSALKIFNLKNIDKKTINHLLLDEKFINNIRNVYTNNISNNFEYLINGNYFYCNVNKLDDNTYILVLNDITDAKNNENIRSEFFANASHELKTPLTSIKGFNEVMMMQNEDQNLEKFLININKETNRVLLLIEDMLKLSKLEAKKEIEQYDINLYELTKEIQTQLQPLIDKNMIHFSIKNNLIIKGEKEHFYELLKNIIENAIKYNYENGEVSVVFDEKNNLKIIEISDNGIGIDNADQKRIFERFYRVNRSRSRNTGGTGLGLAIVKHIVQLYDGIIEVKSSLGVGTTIKIIFDIRGK